MRKAILIIAIAMVVVAIYAVKKSHAFGTGIGTETYEGYVQNGCGLSFGAGLGMQQNEISLGSTITLDSVGADSPLVTIGVFCEGLMTKNFMLGIGVDYGFEDTSPSLTLPGVTIQAEAQDYYSATAKLGRVMTDRKTVIYGLIGAGKILRGKLNPFNVNLPDTSHVITGGGIDYYFNKNIKLGVEAQYWLPNNYIAGPFSVDADQLQFTARLSFKTAPPATVQPFQQPVSPPVINQRPLELGVK